MTGPPQSQTTPQGKLLDIVKKERSKKSGWRRQAKMRHEPNAICRNLKLCKRDRKRQLDMKEIRKETYKTVNNDKAEDGKKDRNGEQKRQ